MRQFFPKFEENLAALFMGGLLFTLLLQVFTRYVLNDPLSWTEEVARYLYVYIVFLGASAAISDRTHGASTISPSCCRSARNGFSPSPSTC